MPSSSVTTAQLVSTEWRFLSYGLLMAFWSSLGQTFFISLFSADIRGDLGLSHGEFGSYYAIATTASAVCLFWVGRLADTIAVPRLSVMTLAGVCLAALFFSTVGSVITLIIGIFLLRLSGQGMMYHVFSTAIARRYRAVRGRALAIAGFGMSIAEALFPIGVVLALSFMSWRTVWMLLPLFAFITFAPLIPVLTRRTPFQDGPGRQNSREKADGGQNAEAGAEQRHVTDMGRAEVVRDPAFWCVIIWLMMIPGFAVTGLFFHQIHIAEMKQIPLLLWTSHYVWYAVAAVFGAMFAGILIDRFSAHRIAAVTQLPLLASSLLIWLVSPGLGLVLFFVLFGISGGMMQPTINALLAERYGTSRLGEIKAVATPMNVFSSALSPAVMGLMIDAGVGMFGLSMMLATLASLNVLMPFFWFNIARRMPATH